ncbi:hypothetical protein A3J13_02105 [Candidatus Daviesbacteria bacterium RIFCSPLOWO2_02_FULL_36_8]|uniref:Hydrolase TatD n=1 Tax=Candidatus Daviesbacteria bacterium RIFCSPLOWO2_02_FULL_36_8 TaxID=1797793 RepID=A0A1F5MFC7_9BACT|nr:MAG: hypothetical protein A3J13_02105 [Candidatus Daviesbacteria bacterium RIFCSPLOWO2_02_FULL_36_8]
MLVDTHAHLYWESYYEDLDAVIQRSIDSGVTTIINVGVDVKLSKKAAEQTKEKLRKVNGLSSYSTIGIHPHESVKYPDDVSIHKDIEELEKVYQSLPDQIVAVGECGLDYFFSHIDPEYLPYFAPFLKEPLKDRESWHEKLTPDVIEKLKDSQRRLFQAQIDLAKRLDLPLIVHCRDDRSQNPENSEAWDEILNMVGNHPTILHCYSGLPKTTQKVLASPTLLFSFGGTITYSKNEYLREAVKLIPLDRIVLETDCPFLPPQSIRGQRNEPSAVLEIAKLITDLKGVSLDEVARQTTQNAKQILRIK